MSDAKSKLPDMNELGKMAGKLFSDVKKSVTEIMSDFKKSHDTATPDIKPEAPKEEEKPKDE